MNCREIEIAEIADRYLREELESETRNSYEEHFFDCPRCFRDLELRRDLVVMYEVRGAEATRTAPGGKRKGILSGGHFRSLGFQPAAISLLILLGFHFLWTWGFKIPGLNRRIQELTSPAINVPVFSLSPSPTGPGAEPMDTRSGTGKGREGMPTILFPTGSRSLILHLNTFLSSSPSVDSFSVRLFDESGTELWSAAGLRKMEPYRVLSMEIPATYLKGDRFRLEVGMKEENGPGRDQKEVYRFSLRREGS